MSNEIASAYYKGSTTAGVVIVKRGNKFGVGNFQHIPGIGERYIIRSHHATESEARAKANLDWTHKHWIY